MGLYIQQRTLTVHGCCGCCFAYILISVDGLKIMERVGKKKKGGAEKIRDKRQKSLQAEASGCFKIDRLFAVASASTVAASAPDVPAATT